MAGARIYVFLPKIGVETHESRERICSGAVNRKSACRSLPVLSNRRMAKIPSQLYIIHLALMLGPAFFAAALYFVILPQNTEVAIAADQALVYKIVAAALAVIGVGLAQLVPKYIFRGEKSIAMAKYTSMKIVQWAMLEGSAMFLAVVYFLTHEQSMLISMGVLIALMAMMRPTVDEIVRYNVK